MMVKTLTIGKYFVGSGANPMQTHIVWKSSLMVLVLVLLVDTVKSKSTPSPTLALV